MEITLDLALARRLLRHLTTVLSDDFGITTAGLDPDEAVDDLVELARLVWDAEEVDGE